MNDHTRYADLAWGLLYGTLDQEEKRRALQLAAAEPEFVDVLRREAALKNALEELKTAMPPEAKVRVLASIQGTRMRAVFQAVARKVLERTLPQAAGPVWEIFERSVLCSEQL